MRSAFCLAVVSLWLLGSTAPAAACSCVQPALERNYAFADAVLKVVVLGQVPSRTGQRRFIAVTTAAPYKGCVGRHRLVLVETAASSAECGVVLAPGRETLLFAASRGLRFGMPLLGTGLCSGNRDWGELAPEELEFLSTRYNCCGDACACVDSELVQCLVDPCSVSECSDPDAVCSASYCGGCNAEWRTPDGMKASCEQPASPACDNPARRYVAHDPEACQTVRFACEADESAFFDDCGCGCESSAARPDAVAPCRHAGCSGELCLGPDDEEQLTTCVVRPEHACLHLTTCEPQTDGSCGFTQSSQYAQCLQDANPATP